MGTSFDCFDPKNGTDSLEISPEQRQWRMALVTAMEQNGFKNYAGEWWHFTYTMQGIAELKYYDFPILPRLPTGRAPASSGQPGGVPHPDGSRTEKANAPKPSPPR